MKCPSCGHSDDRVLDTRELKEGSMIRRRRECLECKSRFTTVESLILNFPLVIKKDSRREAFSREKIFRGIQAACQKRPVSLAQMESIVDSVSMWALSRGEKEIPSQLLGYKVMQELRMLDDVAYVRFASVYRTFKDLQEFVDTLDEVDPSDAIAPSNPQLSLNGLNPCQVGIPHET